MKIIRQAAAVLAVMLSVGIVQASGPIGVYALVDKVAFEPSDDKPERIRISGVFMVAEATPDNSTVYAAPQRGYVYLALPRGNEELARREWADLRSVAGTRKVVGLGSSWGAKVHVWKADEVARAASDYPLGNGLATINSDNPRARALLEYKER